MGGKLFRLVAFLVLALAISPSGAVAAEQGGCKLGQVAELPVTITGAPVVTVKINGEPARFVIGTAVNFSVVTPRAAERLKLKPKSLPAGFSVTRGGDKISARGGVASEFILGRTSSQNVEFLIVDDVVEGADGILGQNILGQLDVEYDLAMGVIRLLKEEACEKAGLAYWAGEDGYSVVPIVQTTPQIVVQAKVNDLPIRAKLGTGSPRSILTLDAALRAGATLSDQDARRADGIAGMAPNRTESYILPFKSFSIGDETIRNTRLRVQKSELQDADMTLGLDFFLSHRVLVSTGQRKLYFTYSGGPIFRLDEGRSANTAVANGEPVDAEALVKRAGVFSARGDYAQAIAEFDKAITLAPNEPQLYLGRARANVHAKQFAQAKADLDQTLKLEPGQPDALAIRGSLHLTMRELPEADADFEAARRITPPSPKMGLLIADMYLWAGYPEQAVALFDAWFAAYPQSPDVSAGLNGRCWARALWGRELDKALTDCNQAIKRGKRLSDYLDSRGMVYLRRGQFDAAIADYNEALRLQPKLAWSLYGRGLARLKRGDAAAGASDVEAALALDSEIADRSKRLGLTEATIVVAQVP